MLRLDSSENKAKAGTVFLKSLSLVEVRTMKNGLIILSLLAVCAAGAGCAHTKPWSKATASQRASGNFTEDDAYLASPQCAADVEESANVVIRLRHKTYGTPLYGVPEN